MPGECPLEPGEGSELGMPGLCADWSEICRPRRHIVGSDCDTLWRLHWLGKKLAEPLTGAFILL